MSNADAECSRIDSSLWKRLVKLLKGSIIKSEEREDVEDGQDKA
jgi:hypothetical protein